MKIRILSFLPAIAWFALSFYLLTLPGSSFPKEDWFDKIEADKWVHVFLFGTLVVLAYWPWHAYWGKPFVKIACSISVAALAYGIAMEFVQKYCIPMRSFDIWDIAADGVGSFLPFFWILIKKGKSIQS